MKRAGRLRSKICGTRLEPGQTLGRRAYRRRQNDDRPPAARFYDPQEGSIELAGTDIRDCKLHELRRKVAMVTQNIEILEGTVRDNLTLFDEGIEDRRIISVLEELGLETGMLRFPKGSIRAWPQAAGACRPVRPSRWRLPASF